MDRERILGITTNDASKAFDGYTLFSPYGRTQTYLVNMDGVVVHEWETGYQPGNWGYLLENGNHESHFIKDIPAATSRVRVLDARTGEAVLARPLWSGTTSIGVPGQGPYIVEFFDADGGRIEKRGPIQAVR